MNTTARVSGDGTIRFPVLGILKVGGMNERQFEEMLQDKLRGKYLQEPHVAVFVKEQHAREVAIVGQVKTPGLFPIYGKMSLIELISKAGGLADTAGDTAYIIRNRAGEHNSPTSATLTQGLGSLKDNPHSEKVDLNGLLLRGEEQWNLPLNAGDCVSIPDAGYVHVTGQGVVKPGTFELKNAPNTLSQFIDEAEGLKFSASKKMLLIRKTADGQDLIIPINYKKVLADPSKDVRVQSGDTLIVNRTAIKTVLAAMGSAVSTVFRASIYYNFAPSTN
jgi:polysaccharide biosynthesis/export protein